MGVNLVLRKEEGVDGHVFVFALTNEGFKGC